MTHAVIHTVARAVMEKGQAGLQGIPRELARSAPRHTRLTAVGVAVAAIAVALVGGGLIGGIVLFSIAARDRARIERLWKGGVVIEAEVVELRRTRGEHPKNLVSYTYPAAGRQYSGRTAIRRSEWQQLHVGSKVLLRYVPSEPESSWVLGPEPTATPLWVAPFVAISLFAGAAACGYSLRHQWRLVSEGRPALARVTHSKKIKDGHQVQYEFATLSGALRKGSYGPVKDAPAAGTPVCVVYDPENPSKNSRYPVALVRAA